MGHLHRETDHRDGDDPSRRVSTEDRKSTRLNSSHLVISYAVFCLKKKKNTDNVVTEHKQALIEDWCQHYPSHAIGDLPFGPYGMVHASSGDGASFNYVHYEQVGSTRGDEP